MGALEAGFVFSDAAAGKRGESSLGSRDGPAIIGSCLERRGPLTFKGLHMLAAKEFPTIQKRLTDCLASKFTDVKVEVGDGIHYKGTNVVITSPDFAGLLPEQRFHHVVTALPADLYEKLRAGIVWFELAPGESAKDVMRMPRCEDIAKDEAAILKQLTMVGFFKKFEKTLMSARKGASQRDFIVARHVLKEAGLSDNDITRASLFFVSKGGFCDGQILTKVMDEIAGDHGDEEGASKKKPGAKAPG